MISNDLSRDEIRLMDCLYRNKCLNSIRAFTIARIQKETDFKESKTRYLIKSLKRAEYANEGVKDRNAHTYYLTQKGIQLIREVVMN